MLPHLNINNVPGPKSGILKLQKDFFIFLQIKKIYKKNNIRIYYYIYNNK